MWYNWRKYVALFLLLPIGFNTIGNTLLHIAWRAFTHAHIKEVAAEMPLNQLIKITQLGKYSIEKEFEWHGKMYDVVKYEVHGNNVVYYCINDFEEEVITQSYKETQNDLKALQHKAKHKSNNIAKKIFKPVLVVFNTVYSQYKHAKTVQWFNGLCALAIGIADILLLPPKTSV